MGYTIEKGKTVIWTQKYFQSYEYPFNSYGENHTLFYKNLYDNKVLCSCPARLSDEEKRAFVAKYIDTPADKIILKSKRSHNKQKYKPVK